MSVVYTQSHNYSEIVTNKHPEMETNLSQLHLQQQQQHCNNQNNNSGLLRYRSAPSSFLTSLIDTTTTTNIDYVNEETFTTSEDDSSDMETMLANLTNSNQFEVKPMKQEIGYSYGISPSQIIYQQSQQIQSLSNSFDGSFYSENCNNLIRQKSSPAGFFSDYSVHNEIGSFRRCDVSNGQATASTSELHGTLNFSSRPSQIAKFEHESLQANCVENGNIANNNNGSTKCYMPSFNNDFWDASTINTSKTTRNNYEIMFSTSNDLETQDSEFGYQKVGLSHHLSLPSSSTKYLHIQGSTPCKIRAKRGFATHPRSIAERERRIRISSRIKKLEGLFPKSDKPTSTSDMLDMAVEYIKDLRKQVKTLTETKANCMCRSNTQS